MRALFGDIVPEVVHLTVERSECDSAANHLLGVTAWTMVVAALGFGFKEITLTKRGCCILNHFVHHVQTVR